MRQAAFCVRHAVLLSCLPTTPRRTDTRKSTLLLRHMYAGLKLSKQLSGSSEQQRLRFRPQHAAVAAMAEVAKMPERCTAMGLHASTCGRRHKPVCTLQCTCQQASAVGVAYSACKCGRAIAPAVRHPHICISTLYRSACQLCAQKGCKCAHFTFHNINTCCQHQLINYSALLVSSAKPAMRCTCSMFHTAADTTNHWSHSYTSSD